MGNICFRNQSNDHPTPRVTTDEFHQPTGPKPITPQVPPYPNNPHNPRDNANQVTVIVRALYNYIPRTSDDLPFELGEELDVDKKYTTSGRDWWFARSRRTGRTGYIPRNYVADITSLEAEP